MVCSSISTPCKFIQQWRMQEFFSGSASVSQWMQAVMPRPSPGKAAEQGWLTHCLLLPPKSWVNFPDTRYMTNLSDKQASKKKKKKWSQRGMFEPSTPVHMGLLYRHKHMPHTHTHKQTHIHILVGVSSGDPFIFYRLTPYTPEN